MIISLIEDTKRLQEIAAKRLAETVGHPVNAHDVQDWVILAMRESIAESNLSNPLRANKRQIGGSHYKVGGEEHWDRVNRLGLDYFQACITKYVERCWKKNGIQDLQKAQHYLDKYLEIKTAEKDDSKAGPEYVDQDK